MSSAPAWNRSSLRLSAYSQRSLRQGVFNAEITEIRRGPQRRKRKERSPAVAELRSLNPHRENLDDLLRLLRVTE